MPGLEAAADVLEQDPVVLRGIVDRDGAVSLVRATLRRPCVTDRGRLPFCFFCWLASARGSLGFSHMKILPSGLGFGGERGRMLITPGPACFHLIRCLLSF